VRELVDRSIEGDAEAFGRLYDLFSDDVHRYFYHHVGRPEDAEDLVSLTFLRAWRAIPRFRWRDRPFEAWLFTVARSQLLDFRRRKHAPTAPLDDSLQACRDEGPGPEALVLAGSEAAAARAALARLTFEQREVIVLKFYLERDTREIARIMGKREGTVRGLQMRALQALRRHLTDA
jgi:RNA polymerase sigma-70 factor (ECF subfamily)